MPCIFACVALIVALGYIGVSWAVAGAGVCVFATIACAGLLVAKAHEGILLFCIASRTSWQRGA